MNSFKVIGIGDNVVDKYVHQDIMYPGGNALNFSAYATMCGVESAYLGKFGSDVVARYIQEVLDEMKIDHSHSRSYEGENGYARVTLENGDRKFLGSNKGGIANEKAWEFTGDDLEYVKQFAVIHTSLNSYIEQDLSVLKESGVTISYDFSVRWNDDYLQQVCPHIDIAFLSCSHITAEEREREMRKAQHLGARLVVGTVGEEGSYALYGDQWLYQPAVSTEALDTMGAGDSYITAFLVELIRNSRNHKIELEDKDELLQQIKASMDKGAEFAAKICRVNGAFGYSTPLV
ncbi:MULTISPECIES: fructoselysine 6-kinase [unclassified Paenibacillus]|uniref:fructoselysine 6-kinase n=1 Tax=unclassified Paenibacillus TaxID=185978 RepID=UPI002405873C|nr:MULTISPECIES: fructoselysine 6-kinase [unclassified Paenibacillus]MDF9839483.1 fructoselysine 6-kinase [Paenibacillus sp. PastF-2]MDF9846064.1 fructoselysine 6-kinase [Paenibacillus sp. PastM-2]MDF9852637.1 fructoselysine 6-kinase [Paenibacillus sp. PastF-1]MDH6477632.1 fructoselysine 6-kinase [Paenibacillus sp. PastH-2]MDH6505375.1 fructoselysine 6-kinase [Paenibacillus sp. PastM-3]